METSGVVCISYPDRRFEAYISCGFSDIDMEFECLQAENNELRSSSRVLELFDWVLTLNQSIPAVGNHIIGGESATKRETEEEVERLETENRELRSQPPSSTPLACGALWLHNHLNQLSEYLSRPET